MKRKPLQPTAGDALIVVDVQNDFLEGGTLSVPGGEQVVPLLNSYLALFRSLRLPIVVTRDWHPPDHVSFTTQGGPWPPHCVQGTKGAAFAPDLDLGGDETVVSKADNPRTESYSNFSGTDLEERLRKSGIRRVFVGGLATDYCVLHTVLDAVKHGFETVLLTDVIAAVRVKPGDGTRAVEKMTSAGAVTARYRDLVP